VLVLMLRLID